MSDSPVILIKNYAFEKATLEGLLAEALTEEDFLAASYFKNGWYDTNRPHDLFCRLKDKFYTEKKRTINIIAELKNKLTELQRGDEDSYRWKWINNEINKEEEKLSVLNECTITNNDNPGNNLFNELLGKLFKKEITKLSITINKKTNLRLQLEKKKNRTIITLPNLHQLIKNYGLYNTDIKHLCAKGFELKTKPARLVKIFHTPKEADLSELKIFLSRCYFEVLFAHTDDNNFIEYHSKPAASN